MDLSVACRLISPLLAVRMVPSATLTLLTPCATTTASEPATPALPPEPETLPDIPRAPYLPRYTPSIFCCRSATALILPSVAVSFPPMTTLASFLFTETATPTPMELLFSMSDAATPLPTVLKLPLLPVMASIALALRMPQMEASASCLVTLTATAAATWIFCSSWAEESVLPPEREPPMASPVEPLLPLAVSFIISVRPLSLAEEDASLVEVVEAFWACSALVDIGNAELTSEPPGLPLLPNLSLIRPEVLLPAVLLEVPLALLVLRFWKARNLPR